MASGCMMACCACHDGSCVRRCRGHGMGPSLPLGLKLVRAVGVHPTGALPHLKVAGARRTCPSSLRCCQEAHALGAYGPVCPTHDMAAHRRLASPPYPLLQHRYYGQSQPFGECPVSTGPPCLANCQRLALTRAKALCSAQANPALDCCSLLRSPQVPTAGLWTRPTCPWSRRVD